MSAAITDLLIRNLHEVSGEHDPIRRMAAIETLFAPDMLFSDPHGRHVGYVALDRAVTSPL